MSRNQKLCLNMIVKNESRIITRLLESVYRVIDSYCICDTGSTDNTIELIERFFFEKNVPGKIVQEPFRDFGYNRSFALKECESTDADYILLLDADMVFWLNPSLSPVDFKNSLTKDVYHIYQGTEQFYYKNARIVKNRKNICYWGVTHEYVKAPEGSVYESLEKDRVFIKDIGDGGSKSDKYERDIRLLKKGLEENPGNDRYTFYLANSYRDNGEYMNAIETYKKRIELGGWYEEVWHSYYCIGRCYKFLGDMPNAVYWWIEAYNYFPKRIENLYEIIHYYRLSGKNQAAYLYYNMALKQKILNPNPDYLFLQKDVYDYKLDYELSIFGYYANPDNFNLARVSARVLDYPYIEDSIAKNVLSNYKFYAARLKDVARETEFSQLVSIGKEMLGENREFVSSTPSIIISGDRLIANTRYVNYRITSNGGYMNRENITTRNIMAEFSWSVNQEGGLVINRISDDKEMEYDHSLDNLYIGLEDVRLFANREGRIFYNANRGLKQHHMMIEHGELDSKNPTNPIDSGLVFIDKQHQIEKNWVLFEDAAGKTKIIYGWNKLIIGDLVNERDLPEDSDDEVDKTNNQEEKQPTSYVFKKTHEIETPHLFKYLRGSTNGITIGNEIWFLCHSVSYEDRRYYYHSFVVLDAATYKVLRYSPLFTFEKEKVEYTLGFVYFEELKRFLIGYSTMDNTTKYMSVDRSNIDKMLYNKM